MNTQISTEQPTAPTGDRKAYERDVVEAQARYDANPSSMNFQDLYAAKWALRRHWPNEKSSGTPPMITPDCQPDRNGGVSCNWLDAAQDLSSEIYGGKLNLREVPTETFVTWYEWRLATKPNTETGISLKDFDIESAMMFFEDDVKAANDRISDPAHKTP